MLNSKDFHELESAITKAEDMTSCEFVVAELQTSIAPLALKTVAFALASITGSVVFAFQMKTTWPGEVHASHYFLFMGLQLLSGVLGVLLCAFRPFSRLIATLMDLCRTNATRQARVKEVAHEFFLETGLTKTEKRNAVLFFFSEVERSCSVVIDHGLSTVPGIYERISAMEQTLSGNDSNSAILTKFKAALPEFSHFLKTAFPKSTHDRNELSNQVLS